MVLKHGSKTWFFGTDHFALVIKKTNKQIKIVNTSEA